MVQSLNSTIDFTTTGTFIRVLDNKVGKFLIGNQALEFYADSNVEHFIQIPWSAIQLIRTTVSNRKVGRHFEVIIDQRKFRFSSKDTGKILKYARDYIGNEKIVRFPTLIQRIHHLIRKKYFTSKS